jgi:hypothetical protein
MVGGRDYFKLLTKKTQKKATRIPSIKDTLRLQELELKSKYKARELGVGIDTAYITEEQRVDHAHIIGTTNQGKSKFLELLIREDIKRGNGVCLLDPSELGDTCKNILRFCIKQGHERVCIIDPHTIRTYGRVVAINPLNQHHREAAMAKIMDTVRTTFATKDGAETPNIQKYLPAILHCLYNAQMTLSEAVYFTEYKRSAPRRKWILGQSGEFNRHRLALEEAFEMYHRFQVEISSTARRLDPFFNESLQLMFGATKGIDFAKMIAEGWVVLVNLYSGHGFEPIHSRLLGTTVINELIYGLDRLGDNGWEGVYYLYVDEAGRYANRNLADLLPHKRKSGLRVTLAHQYFSQFEDKYVLDAIKAGTDIKIMFNTPSYDDRMEMIKALGYGGDIPHEVATFANQNLPKQQAIIRIGKDDPKRITIPDVKSAKVDSKVEKDFIAKLLTQEWNYSPAEIREQINARFTKRENPVRPGTPKAPNRQAPVKADAQTAKPADVPRDSQKKSPKAGKGKPITF